MSSSSTTESKFLVVIQVTYLTDGAYLHCETQLFWVEASDKRNAAVTAIRYVRRTEDKPLASIKAKNVLAHAQWGSSYFTHIRENDEAQQQSET